MNKIKPNFVIFTEPRTGSTLLCDILRKQRHIKCYKEIFGTGLPDKLKKYQELKEVFKNNEFLGDDKEKIHSIACNNFEKYIEILSEFYDKKIFGYKLFQHHFTYFKSRRNDYLNYLKYNDSKIILLTRTNIFLQYLSIVTARQLKLYSSKILNDNMELIYQLNPLTINYQDYLEYKHVIQNDIVKKIGYINNYNLSYVHITYEDFTGKKYIESFQKIFNLLNLDFGEFIDLRNKPIGTISGSKKINNFSLKEKIINFDGLQKDAELNKDKDLLFILNNEHTL
jgi:LPS sulfotransferase NodH